MTCEWHQVECADVILLNKTDLVDADQVEKTESLLKASW